MILNQVSVIRAIEHQKEMFISNDRSIAYILRVEYRIKGGYEIAEETFWLIEDPSIPTMRMINAENINQFAESIKKPIRNAKLHVLLSGTRHFFDYNEGVDIELN